MCAQNGSANLSIRPPLHRASPMSWIATMSCLGGGPLLALAATGMDVTLYLECPPSGVHVTHAPFSWPWWSCYTLVGATLILVLIHQIEVNIRLPQKPTYRSHLLLFALCGSWAIAWNRWGWAMHIQAHTFPILWGCYIAFMNSLTNDMHSTCSFSAARKHYLLSFPLSALVWWMYEILNRSTQNWRYVHIENFSCLTYVLLSTVSFATVLPAVWATSDLLHRSVLKTSAPHLTIHLSALQAILVLLVSAFILLALPFLSNYLFPFIWILPISLVIVFERLIYRRPYTIQNIAIWGCAGILCGVLWELWNSHSFVKWTYMLPFVERYYIFEMPIVGYAGYIPFGVLCGMVIQSLHRD